MPRPQVHETDTMLDAARDLLLEEGARAATVEAIASASGAPSGSIYHRFRTRDELIARLWIRAVRRSELTFLVAMEIDDPRGGGSARRDVDSRLLRRAPRRREAACRLQTAGPGSRDPGGCPVHEDLEALNRPVQSAVGDLARRLYGKRTRSAMERMVLVTFDIPYGAARRHLIDGSPFPRGLRKDVERAVNAVLKGPPGRA